VIIRCCAKKEEPRGPIRETCLGAAGEKALVVEKENALKAVAVDSMAITADRCLFRMNIIADGY